jgi:hypothetical protein
MRYGARQSRAACVQDWTNCVCALARRYGLVAGPTAETIGSGVPQIRAGRCAQALAEADWAVNQWLLAPAVRPWRGTPNACVRDITHTLAF